jgi:undecaprenyl-diphosphatase
MLVLLRQLCLNLASGVVALRRAPRSARRPMWRAYVRLIWGGLAAAFVIATVIIFVDGPVAEAMKSSPRWLMAVMGEITELGKSGWFLWPIGIALLWVAAISSPGRRATGRLVLTSIGLRLAFLFAAIGLPSLMVALVKRLIGRARPYIGSTADPFLFFQPSWRADYASMPSGHATTAFAAAIAIGLLWPRLRVPMLVYALVIGLTRVNLGVHYVSDVLTGAIAGLLGVLVVRDWFAARRAVFVLDPLGHVHTRPGPSWARLKKMIRRP